MSARVSAVLITTSFISALVLTIKDKFFCVSPLNSELSRFKVVFNKLKELGKWKLPNPLEEVEPFKDSERDMAFLIKEQIRDLLSLVGQHERTDMLEFVKLCLSTGARWNEAAQLKGSHFMMNGGNILVLRDVLGHADISMTMRYAHVARDHLSNVITRNPLSNL
jgi:site-specific recombinase XerD